MISPTPILAVTSALMTAISVAGLVTDYILSHHRKVGGLHWFRFPSLGFGLAIYACKSRAN
jgi:hypothetical protein